MMDASGDDDDDTEIAANNDRERSGDESVGYGRPPKATQFKKGRSGNPKGRPRKEKPPRYKLSDGTFDWVFEDEMARIVRVVEGGKPTEMTTAHALQRSAVVKALGGNRLLLQDMLRSIQAKEELHFQKKMERFRRLEALKRDGEKVLANHARRGGELPELLPHPDDIELDHDTGDVIIHGPKNVREARHWDNVVALRDYLGELAARKCPRASFVQEVDGHRRMNTAWFFADLLDMRQLPRRYKWTEEQRYALVRKVDCMTKREWAVYIKRAQALMQDSPLFQASDLPSEITEPLKALVASSILAEAWINLDGVGFKNDTANATGKPAALA